MILFQYCFYPGLGREFVLKLTAGMQNHALFNHSELNLQLKNGCKIRRTAYDIARKSAMSKETIRELKTCLPSCHITTQYEQYA